MGKNSKPEAQPDHPIRVVMVRMTPHKKRGKQSGSPSDGILRIATNLLDVLAEMAGRRDR